MQSIYSIRNCTFLIRSIQDKEIFIVWSPELETHFLALIVASNIVGFVSVSWYGALWASLFSFLCRLFFYHIISLLCFRRCFIPSFVLTNFIHFMLHVIRCLSPKWYICCNNRPKKRSDYYGGQTIYVRYFLWILFSFGKS